MFIGMVSRKRSVSLGCVDPDRHVTMATSRDSGSKLGCKTMQCYVLGKCNHNG